MLKNFFAVFIGSWILMSCQKVTEIEVCKVDDGKGGIQTLKLDESIKKECNSCTCQAGGELACTKINCNGGKNEPIGCTLNNKSYAIDEIFPSEDGCNSCSCTEGGMIQCTKMAC